MALTLYFLRHGQTALSREDIFCGSGLDPELTSEGREMAQAFVKAYREAEWRAVIPVVCAEALQLRSLSAIPWESSYRYVLS